MDAVQFLLLQSLRSSFAGADADGVFDVGNENLSVTNAACSSSVLNGFNSFVYKLVGNHDFDFHFGQKVHNIFGTPVQFRMALLAAKALGFGDSDALQAHLLQGLFHFIKLEWLDDGFDLLHGGFIPRLELQPDLQGLCQIHFAMVSIGCPRIVKVNSKKLPKHQSFAYFLGKLPLRAALGQHTTQQLTKKLDIMSAFEDRLPTSGLLSQTSKI
jgi:hypothetical protein